MTDPIILAALAFAPLDDEPVTSEQREAIARAREAFARGEGVSHEEAARRLGIDFELDHACECGADEREDLHATRHAEWQRQRLGTP